LWTRRHVEPRGERLAFEILHDEEVGALFATDVMERADVRMVQRRDGARFAVEAFAELRIRRQRVRQDLDRHRAIEARIARPIHLPHAARAEGRLDLIRAETGACDQSHVRECVAWIIGQSTREQGRLTS